MVFSRIIPHIVIQNVAGCKLIIINYSIKCLYQFYLQFVQENSCLGIPFLYFVTKEEDSYTIVPNTKVLHEQGGLQIYLYVSFLFKITLLCHFKTHQKSIRKDPAGPNEGFFKQLKDSRSKIAPIFDSTYYCIHLLLITLCRNYMNNQQ